MDISYEKQVAIAAVRRACGLTSSVFQHLLKGETVIKSDESPVTIGDFSSQAVINTVLSHAFPDDPVVGEEDAAELRAESGVALRERIVKLVNETLTLEVQEGEKSEWGLGVGRSLSPAAVLDMIDRGKSPGGDKGRIWTLDPIDGTKGFLRGGQYAVCLALMIDSRVELGVVGCPNLPVSPDDPSGPQGCIFYAIRGQGTYQVPLSTPFTSTPLRLRVPAATSANLRIWQSIGHTRLDLNERVVQELSISTPSVSMDSQAKYCSVVREGGIYLRLAGDLAFREKIWDHAPSSILVEEAGGKVTDADGKALDFGQGRTLALNYGIIAAGKNIHQKVLQTVTRLRQED